MDNKTRHKVAASLRAAAAKLMASDPEEAATPGKKCSLCGHQAGYVFPEDGARIENVNKGTCNICMDDYEKNMGNDVEKERREWDMW